MCYWGIRVETKVKSFQIFKIFPFKKFSRKNIQIYKNPQALKTLLFKVSPFSYRSFNCFTYSFLGGSDGKESTYNVVDLGLIPGLGRSPGIGHGNPLQYSCLENPMDRGSWQLQSMGSQSWTWLSDLARAHTNTHTHTPLNWKC